MRTSGNSRAVSLAAVAAIIGICFAGAIAAIAFGLSDR
jgi:hypothetical protein